MRKAVLFFLITFSNLVFAQVKFCSWNLCNLGKSKTDTEIAFIAETLKEYDLIAVQEIVAGPEGAKAVSRLALRLNRTGAKWLYCVSETTTGTRQKKERYAFLWKPSRVRQKSKAWLDQNFADEIEREPYLGTFVYERKEFTIVNFHAITKKMQPETEIKFFKFLPARYPQHNLVFAGDFNCPQTHSVFNPLKKLNFAPALIDVKTTLRMACKNGCTASMFDNAFYRTDRVRIENSGAFPFYSSFADLKAARAISDHLPIWLTFWPN